MKLLHARRATAPIGIVVAILDELLDALDYASNAHDSDGLPLQIVHRDLSPSNLIITDEGNLKIIDFGVAKSLTSQFMTSSGLVKGKLGYMAFEALAAQEIDRRADIYSVGVVGWELITGRRLFVGVNEHEVITKIRKGCRTPPSRLNKDCSPELDEIVMHALSRDRDERWPSAAVMKRALGTLRRTYRHGVPELAAWKRALVPEPIFEEGTTTEHELSMADMVMGGASVVSKQIVAPEDIGLDQDSLGPTILKPNRDDFLDHDTERPEQAASPEHHDHEPTELHELDDNTAREKGEV
jgi:serine/threonine protein kinase